MAGKAASEKQIWWVLQAQAGSREALDELFKSVQEPLFRYIVAVVKDRHLAEDVLQEVFIRIHRKLRWLREPQAFRAWSALQPRHRACPEGTGTAEVKTSIRTCSRNSEQMNVFSHEEAQKAQKALNKKATQKGRTALVKREPHPGSISLVPFVFFVPFVANIYRW